MTEKNFVIHDLRFNYNGPLSIPEFYKVVDDWMAKKGMQRETKKKYEHVTAKGKEIEWLVELWKELTEYATDIVALRAMFHNVKEITLKRNGRTIKINQVDCLIVVDGLIETHLHTQWEQEPLFYFLRMLADKYIWKFHTEKYHDVVGADAHELFNFLRNFFKEQKAKYI